jgi:hypothetical protein
MGTSIVEVQYNLVVETICGVPGFSSHASLFAQPSEVIINIQMTNPFFPYIFIPTHQRNVK